MSQPYTTTGNACRSHVEKKRNSISEVEITAVDLEIAETINEMGKQIPLCRFQEALKKHIK